MLEKRRGECCSSDLEDLGAGEGDRLGDIIALLEGQCELGRSNAGVPTEVSIVF